MEGQERGMMRERMVSMVVGSERFGCCGGGVELDSYVEVRRMWNAVASTLC